MESTAAKLLSLEAALGWRRALAGPLVFTNGVFDLLHPGHVEYLEAARELGHRLLVAVNSDRSVRALAKASTPGASARKRYANRTGTILSSSPQTASVGTAIVLICASSSSASGGTICSAVFPKE